MSEYRNKITGEIASQGIWRKRNPNTSLPKVWKQPTLDSLNLEPVFNANPPTTTKFQVAVKNGVEQDANGNWVTAWAVRDMFADTTAEDGTVTTKAEHEAAYQAQLDEQASAIVRERRNKLLAETDYLALTDNTLSDTTKAYRQALRDITSHVNFPYLSEEDWPVKPV